MTILSGESPTTNTEDPKSLAPQIPVETKIEFLISDTCNFIKKEGDIENRTLWVEQLESLVSSLQGYLTIKKDMEK